MPSGGNVVIGNPLLSSRRRGGGGGSRGGGSHVFTSSDPVPKGDPKWEGILIYYLGSPRVEVECVLVPTTKIRTATIYYARALLAGLDRRLLWARPITPTVQYYIIFNHWAAVPRVDSTGTFAPF